MYGSDFPNIPYAWDRELKWLRNSGLPQEDLEWILVKSAAHFFGFAQVKQGK
jgi:predicted TIM-barrel fold metal-dependent hydrolase